MEVNLSRTLRSSDDCKIVERWMDGWIVVICNFKNAAKNQISTGKTGRYPPLRVVTLRLIDPSIYHYYLFFSKMQKRDVWLNSCNYSRTWKRSSKNVVDKNLVHISGCFLISLLVLKRDFQCEIFTRPSVFVFQHRAFTRLNMTI